MKRFVYILGLVLALAGGLVTESCSTLRSDSESGLTKAQKKAQREYEDSIVAEVARRAVLDSSFIAGADQLTLKRGRTFNVASNLNYVAVKGNSGVIQLASTYGMLGFNGLGGVTLEGTVRDMDVKYDKKGNLTMSMRIVGSGRSGEVVLQMAKGSNRAVVQVKGTFSSSSITMYCTVTSYEPYKIVQGRSL
ncbi:MAG: DUF4251 domain-containing protein [Muribaculaceae bacterium]|jgi:hypothetical protein|nr:DUF4251 domain-containing protein [Muribaculaceae bacterium]